jgi:hypothetical protein
METLGSSKPDQTRIVLYNWSGFIDTCNNNEKILKKSKNKFQKLGTTTHMGVPCQKF